MNLDLEFDLDLYPLDAVMDTAYVFIDRCYVLLDKVSDSRVRVSLSGKPRTSDEVLKAIEGEFREELCSQLLRQRIGARHEKVREAIVVRALFGVAPVAADSTALPSDEEVGIEQQFVPAEGEDYLDDPLGIAVPWEEKYGAKASDKPAEPAAGATAGSQGAAAEGSERGR